MSALEPDGVTVAELIPSFPLSGRRLVVNTAALCSTIAALRECPGDLMIRPNHSKGSSFQKRLPLRLYALHLK